MFVVVSEPGLEGLHQLQGAGPFLQLEALLFEGPHEALCVCIALRIVVTGERLMDLQCRAGLPEGRRGRLTPIVTHQRHALASDALGELPVDHQSQRFQPLLRRASKPSGVTPNGLRLPLAPNDDSDPAYTSHEHLGHVEAPPRMGPDRLGFAATRRPLGLQPPVGRDQEARLTHQPPHPPLIDR